jgi:hypothetical protein
MRCIYSSLDKGLNNFLESLKTNIFLPVIISVGYLMFLFINHIESLAQCNSPHVLSVQFFFYTTRNRVCPMQAECKNFFFVY